MLEKRKFIRLQAPIGVTYKTVKKQKRPKVVPTFLRDISGGGVRVMMKDAVRSGELLELQIQIPHLHEPIAAIGEVMWVEPQKDRGGYEAGLCFRDIEPEDLHSILEYVHSIGIG